MILHRCKMRFLLLLWLCASIVSAGSLSWQPCPELSSALRYPCRCKVEPFGPKSQLGAVSMDCDYVVFHTESPILPNGAPIISFSQRHCGQQVLPTQVRREITLSKLSQTISSFHWLCTTIPRVCVYNNFFLSTIFIPFLGICNNIIATSKLRLLTQLNSTITG